MTDLLDTRRGVLEHNLLRGSLVHKGSHAEPCDLFPGNQVRLVNVDLQSELFEPLHQ